jgi:hypothetical protein
MSDFKTRLETEQKELLEKIEKLDEFLNKGDIVNITTDQLSLLRIQLKAMDTYNTCLIERIVRL